MGSFTGIVEARSVDWLLHLHRSGREDDLGRERYADPQHGGERSSVMLILQTGGTLLSPALRDDGRIPVGGNLYRGGNCESILALEDRTCTFMENDKPGGLRVEFRSSLPRTRNKT